MSGSPGALCFTCGQPISDPPRFNHLGNGRPCPACRDRLLASLPAALPAGRVEAELEEPELPAQPVPAPAPLPRAPREDA